MRPATLFSQLGNWAVAMGRAGQVRLGDPLGFPPPTRAPWYGAVRREAFRDCPLISRSVA